MFKRHYLMLLCFVIVLLLPSGEAATQENTEWQLVLYAHDSREIVTVTPDGIVESMVLPDSMPEPEIHHTLDSVRLSPDGRYFAYLNNDELVIYDFFNETEVAYPPIDFIEGRIRFEIGDFSPNSQQFVAGFIVHNSVESRGGTRMAQDRGGLMTFEIGNSDSPSAWVISAIDDWFPLQTRWEEPNRIVFYGVGNAYEYGPRWYERVWIPGQLETLTTTDVNGVDGQTQVLPNREIAVSRNDFSYPHSGDQGIYGYFSNVIVYYDDLSDFTDNLDPTVIFWSEDDQKIRNFNWIANGRGLLIQTDPQTLLTRDGSIQTVDQSGEMEIIGTPDGWVVQDGDSLIHYVLQSDNAISSTEIAKLAGHLTLLESTPFDDIDGGTFAGIEPYDWGSNLCDNGIPSTIRSGMYALIIRDEDARLFSTYEEGKIGLTSLSYYAPVTILDGPECVDGVPWWKVEVGNETQYIGWLPEFTDSGERWLEQRGPAGEETMNYILEREAEGYYPTGRPDYTCGGFYLPVRLDIGDKAYVAEGAPNNVRSAPSSDADLVGQIPGGAAFDVIGGPACQNEIVWWEVEYEGITGWTGEGSGSGYWVQLEPPGQESVTNRDETQFVRCPGFLPSRLMEGQTGRVTPGNVNDIYKFPRLSEDLIGEIPGGETFMVLAGPQCLEGRAWWRVDYNGPTGWTAEGLGDTYWLEPLGQSDATSTDTTQISQCPGFLPSRLTIGQTGKVTPGAANNVRAEPASSAELIGQIPGGESFTVLAGPTCADETAWWQVDYEGLIGWTAEGQGDAYWLEP